MTRKEIMIFYDTHKKRLFNMSLRITGDGMDAEEIVQDAIIKFLRVSDRRMSPEQIDAWLAKTCIRASIDVVRKRRAVGGFLEEYGYDFREDYSEMSESTSQVWKQLMEEDSPSVMMQKIKKALSSLPDGYRVVLSMILFEGFDYSETAQVLGVKEATVRSQYMRGRLKLIDEIKKFNIK